MMPELTIIPERPAIELDPRRIFTPRQKAQLFLRAKGKCELCLQKIRGTWIAGHIIAWALGGRTTVKNGRVECRGCAKGTHSEDTAKAARCERLALRKGQQARKTRRGGSSIKGPSKEQRRAAYIRARAAQQAMKERNER